MNRGVERRGYVECQLERGIIFTRLQSYDRFTAHIDFQCQFLLRQPREQSIFLYVARKFRHGSGAAFQNDE